MATFTSKTTIEYTNEAGEQPSKEFDEAALSLASLTGYTVKKMLLAAAGSDVAISFTSAIGLFIYSHDNPFKLRLAAGETLMANLRKFEILADDTVDGVLATSVLLSGNTVTPSDLEIWIIEKP